MSTISATILAAGQGTRLKSVTGDQIPKCLLPIHGVSLLERHISILKSLNISDIKLVVGGAGPCWETDALDRIREITSDIIVNEKCLETQSPYSLYLSLQNRDPQDINFIFDGDLIFEKNVFEALIVNEHSNLLLSLAIESRAINNRGSKIITDENDKIILSENGLNSYRLYSGMLKVDREGFSVLKAALDDEALWNRELAAPLDVFCKNTDVYTMTLNTSLSQIDKTESGYLKLWQGEARSVEKIDNCMRKSASVGREKLKNEFDWIQTLPEHLKKHFPSLISSDFTSDPAYYEMEYYAYDNLIDLIKNTNVSTQAIQDSLRKVFDFNFNELYHQNISQPEWGFVRHSYIQKFENRVESIKGMSPELDVLFNAETIVINGKSHINASVLLKNILEDIKFLSTLEPCHVSLYHGDFKFDNILMDIDTDDFILIDPRGKTATGSDESDFMEDIAKFRTSSHGYYDLIMDGKFDLSVDENVNVHFKFRESGVIPRVDTIDECVFQFLREKFSKSEDVHWHKRLLFLEAVLLLANAPFHYLKDDMNSVLTVKALYIRGVQLLNEFIALYPLTDEEKFNIININSEEQLRLAEKIFD